MTSLTYSATRHAPAGTVGLQRRWERPALVALLLGTGVLYFVGLTSSGWANSFYSAAAQAGSASWKAFFFGSSDAASSITVDKTPASLWVMALSVRAFGLSSFSILMPEVLMGVASVGALYATVRRQFGSAAGLLAGAVLALTPVAVLMFRFNNPDALLVLLMTLGAYATVRAVEKASPRWLMAVGVLVGLGFLTKMLQALLVVPAFAIAYLVAAPTPLRKRLAHLLAAGAALVVSAGWWVAVVQLVPASARPYIGGSRSNSVLELALGYNGLGRLTGNETGSVGGGQAGTASRWGATGLGRMFSAEVGGQVSWLIPSALVLLATGLWLRRRQPRTDARRAAYLMWGTWLVVTMLTFSLMAGIFHAYYTVALAPAIGALIGMGAVEAWEHRRQRVGIGTLSVATVAATAWSWVLLTRTPSWHPWLHWAVLAVGLATAAVLAVRTRVHRRVVVAGAAAAVISGLAGPAAYAASTITSPHTGSIPSAGPAVPGGQRGFGAGPGGPPAGFPGRAGGPGAFAAGPGQGGPQGGPGGQGGPAGQGGAGRMGGLLDASTPDAAVVRALKAGASGYSWVAAAVGSQNAAGLQLATQLPVMAIGGFNGSDPSPTLAQFQAWVSQGRIHYFAASAGGGPGGGAGGPGAGGTGSASQISAWVQQEFTAVSIGSQTFYDLTAPASSAAGTATSTSAT